MIGDCKRLHAPFLRTGNNFFDANHTIHLAHDRMQMQLDTFFKRVIHPFLPKIICRFDSGNG